MSPRPAASFASARGMGSRAASSAVTAAAKRAFGMCEGAAAAGVEEQRKGWSTSWHSGNVPHTLRPSRRQQQQQEAPAPMAGAGHSAQARLYNSPSFSFGGGSPCSSLARLKSLEPALQGMWLRSVLQRGPLLHEQEQPRRRAPESQPASLLG